tara:strand:+ start:4832 stop:5695 length:864 start_codon:yes stop_codon:yes gene_type:complete
MKIKKEIIVTGSAGFLGECVIQNISKKFKVIGIDRKKNNTIQKNTANLKVSIKKFIDKKDFKNVHGIIHLATSNSQANVYKKNPHLANKNINDLTFILEKLKKSKKKILLIFASSKDVNNNKKLIYRDLYSYSKEYSEDLIKTYSLNSRFNFYILRIPDLYDADLNKNPKKKALYKISTLIDKSKNIIIDNPNHIFEFVLRKNIAKLISNILNKKNIKNTLLSIEGEKINILDFVKKFIKSKSSNSKIVVKKKIIKKNNYFIKNDFLKKKGTFFKSLLNPSKKNFYD